MHNWKNLNQGPVDQFLFPREQAAIHHHGPALAWGDAKAG
jgi:hypothetical protein